MMIAACLVGLLTLRVPAQESPQQATDREIAALRAEVQELKLKQAKFEAAAQPRMASQLTESSESIDATKNEVAHDAAKRSTTAGAINLSPVLAGYDSAKGFVLRSDDGKFLLHPWVLLQFRNVTNYNDGTAAGGDNLDNGFEVRRLKFAVDGNVFSPDTTYMFIWQSDRNTGDVMLEEASVRTKLSPDFYLRGGQMKDPYAHESLVSSKKLMSSDRALVTDLLAGNDNYVQGLAAGYTHNALQAELAITDGFNEANRNFQDFPINAWDFGVAGRVQYKIFGDWSAYDQFTSLGVKQDTLVVGGGADVSQGGDTTQILHTIDAQFNNTAGLGVYGALFGRYTDNGPKSVTVTAANESDRYDWGAVAQVSYLAPHSKAEPFARYDYINFDSDTVAAGAEQHVHEITVGVNYYAFGQNAKFTLDVMYLPNGTPVADMGSDVEVSSDHEVVLQVQMQLAL